MPCHNVEVFALYKLQLQLQRQSRDDEDYLGAIRRFSIQLPVDIQLIQNVSCLVYALGIHLYRRVAYHELLAPVNQCGKNPRPSSLPRDTLRNFL